MTLTVIVAVLAGAVLVATAGLMVKMLLVLDEMKAAAELVAANLIRAQTAVDAVASDLDAAHRRADAVEEGQPGEAADVAARSQPEN